MRAALANVYPIDPEDLSASGGFIRLWRIYPPLEDLSAFGLVRRNHGEDLSASGGFIRLWTCPP